MQADATRLAHGPRATDAGLVPSRRGFGVRVVVVVLAGAVLTLGALGFVAGTPLPVLADTGACDTTTSTSTSTTAPPTTTTTTPATDASLCDVIASQQDTTDHVELAGGLVVFIGAAALPLLWLRARR
jgi:hypothetical protein